MRLFLRRRDYFCLAKLRKAARALPRSYLGLCMRSFDRWLHRSSMIRSVDALASLSNLAGVQEASMVSVPQFLSSGQSAGFTRSSIASWLPASDLDSQSRLHLGVTPQRRSPWLFPRAAMSSVIRLSFSSENRLRKSTIIDGANGVLLE